jgi:GMP synthase (glutamine-hydrolysing)
VNARALVVQHTAAEGLGWFADWLPDAGVAVHQIHPYLGNPVPKAVDGDALIVLGGPMGANDDADAGWLPAVRDLLRTAVDDGVPTLGICLGAQLLAVACGGEVERGRHGPELGLGDVVVKQSDALLSAGTLPVVQWHFDTVTRLPAAATLLASSTTYDVQAFRVGEVAWGLQFHVEATPAMVATWAANDASSLEADGRSADGVADAVAKAEFPLRRCGQEIARRFAAVVTG